MRSDKENTTKSSFGGRKSITEEENRSKVIEHKEPTQDREIKQDDKSVEKQEEVKA